MCGICLVVNGVDINKHRCSETFNIFRRYAENSYVEEHPSLKSKYLTSSFDFIQHLKSNNLLIDNSISISDINATISPRGPNAFSYKQFNLSSNGQQTFLEPILSENLMTPLILSSSPLLSHAIDEESKEDPSPTLSFTFCSSLLHLRGKVDHLNIQPITSLNEEKPSIMIYNGEIFSKKDSTIKSPTFNPYQSDTQFLFSYLEQICSETPSNLINTSIASGLESLTGDYAFAYYSPIHKKLFVAKDPFGKRSLLLGFNETGFIFSSNSINVKEEKLVVSPDAPEESEEAESSTSNVKFNLKDPEQRIKFLEKKYLQDFFLAKEKEWIEVPANTLLSIDFSDPSSPIWDATDINPSLYSGTYSLTKEMKPIEIASDDAIKTVIRTIHETISDLVRNIFQFKDHFIEDHLSLKTEDSDSFGTKFPPNVLHTSLKTSFSSYKQTTSSICVLFSGGLDSTLLTLFLDKILPINASIDLLNVSFKSDASDRLTGISAFNELQSINPNRKYNFILIDKTIDDLKTEENRLMKLIYPRTTHMDFNIALVLFLASKGTGYLHKDEEKSPITSGAKVILSGLGADEIFGGYSRYRIAFQRSGYEDLTQEMKFDLQRLWIRNLGRDDRAISENGREVRFPFLNENLIKIVQQNIDFSYFTNFNRPKGSGDKLLLRQVAFILGLIMTSGFRKKAIQFGTGIAKQSNIRNFGSNRKAKGCYKYTGAKETVDKK